MGQLVKAHENSGVVKLLKYIVTLTLVVTQNNCGIINCEDFHCRLHGNADLLNHL